MSCDLSHDVHVLQVPKLKRKNSKPPNFPAIEELTETESVTSPGAVASKKRTPPVGKLQQRPTTLSLHPDPSGSPQASKKGPIGNASPSKPKHYVTFADQVPEQPKTLPSVSKRLAERKKTAKKTAEGEGQARQGLIRKRVMRGGRGMRRKQFMENSFDADDEEMDTPHPIFTYPSNTWPLKETLSPSSSLTTSPPTIDSISPQNGPESITITAVVHQPPSPPPDHSPTRGRWKGGQSSPEADSSKNRGMFARQHNVEPQSSSYSSEEETEENHSSPRVVVKPSRSNTLPGEDGVPPTAPDNGGKDSTDLFHKSLQQSLTFLSSSLPETTSHMT